MNSLNIETISILFATFLAAGMVKGVSGMGLPTVAMGILGVIMSPITAAAVLIIPSFVTNVWQMLSGQGALKIIHRLWSMMLCIVIGTLLGAKLLAQVDPVWSSRGLGVALIAYVIYAFIVPKFSVPRQLESMLSPITGLVTGLLTGATGVFTLPALPYLQSLGLDKDELVQALGLSFTVSTIALAAGLWTQSAFNINQLGISTLAIIPSLLGMWGGSLIRAKISQQSFRRWFLIFLLCIGIELIVRTSAG